MKRTFKILDKSFIKDFVEERFLPSWFCEIDLRTGAREKDRIIPAIVYKVGAKHLWILDLDSKKCKTEYKDILKEWDCITYLPIWCAERKIPWFNFSYKIGLINVRGIRGIVYDVPVAYHSVSRKRKRRWNGIDPLIGNKKYKW